MNSLTKMSILKSLLGGLTFFCLVSLTNVIFAQNDLFTEVAVETIQLTENQVKILNGLQQHRTTIDLKVISVNKEILMSQQSIDMNLFSGQKFTASTVKIDKRGDRDFTWYGSVRGKVSNIVLSVYEDAVVGFMNIEAESYNLRALGESLNAIIRVDPSKYPPCGNTPNFDNIQNNPIPSKNAQDVFSGQSQNFFSKASSLETSQDDVNLLSSGNTIIKVLVAYTPAARDGEGGVNAMNALICNSIAAANQSYNNSNIPIQLELALRVEVNYTKVGTKEPFETECVVGEQHPSDLMRFQNPSDGYMDEIHDLRALSAADVAVLLFIPQFPVAVRGEAFTIGAIDSEAFCVVDHLFADADKSWTFAHEIGHLQGARHEHENDSGECPFAFGHGHLLSTVPQKKTMMAVKPGPDRIQYWSDPTATFQGVPLGVAGVSDNAIALTETAPSVANLEQEGGTV
ncbi:MAG: M12 family metallo-peptidase, partial [bacterium]